MKFQDSTCVVVGASGGIGVALVHELRSRGACVLPVIGPSCPPARRATLRVDLTSATQVHMLANQLKKSGRTRTIDCLFNAAGIAAYKPLSEMTAREIDVVLRVNLYGAIVLTQQLIPLVRSGGYIVHIGSLAGLVPGHKFFSAYAASKEGLIGFLRSVSSEFPDIRFVAATPAGVDTCIAKRAIGSSRLQAKFRGAKLDTPSVVARGILDNLARRRRDVRLFPTGKSRALHAKLAP